MHHTTTSVNGHGHHPSVPPIEPFDEYCQGVLDLSARVFALAAEESPQLRTLLRQSGEEIESLRKALAGRAYYPTQTDATMLEPLTQLREDFRREVACLRDELRQDIRTFHPSVGVQQVRLEIDQLRLVARAAQAENDRLQATLERLSVQLSSQPRTDTHTSGSSNLTEESFSDLEIEK